MLVYLNRNCTAEIITTMEKLHFTSAKSFWPMAGIWFGIITGIAMIAIGIWERTWFYVLFGLLSAPLNIWALLNTRYEISDNKLRFTIGFDKKVIEINSIRAITKNSNLRGLEAAALATGGLQIHYNKYDEVYISPNDQEQFIDAILKINPGVEVREAFEVKEAFNFNKY